MELSCTVEAASYVRNADDGHGLQACPALLGAKTFRESHESTRASRQAIRR